MTYPPHFLLLRKIKYILNEIESPRIKWYTKTKKKREGNT